MGKIVSVVGNLGAGKTTLARLICKMGSFTPYWERPEERPFQARLSTDTTRWALANQVDFFLFRSEQEIKARQKDEISIFDGGLDQDFHVFTRHLIAKGNLTPDEFEICQQFYQLARSFLPPPDLIIRIMVNHPKLIHRRAIRVRKTVDQLFDDQEFTEIEALLDEWINNDHTSTVLRFQFDRDVDEYMGDIEELVIQVKRSLAAPMKNQARPENQAG